MRESIWDNPDYRRLTYTWISVILALGLAAALWWHIETERLYHASQQRSLAVVGKLASLHPEWSDEAARSLANAVVSDDYVRRGTELARTYGLDDTLPLSLDSLFARFDRSGILTVSILVALAGAGLLAAVYRSHRKLYRQVTDYAELAERMVEGDFSIKLVPPKEGAFSKLAHQFGQMAVRLEWTLERLQQEKDAMKRLLSDISHQLKTPLASLKMFNELLLDDNESLSQTRADFLAKSAVSIERMEWLIRQLLTVARLEAEAIHLELRDAPLAPVLEQAVHELAPKAGQAGVRVLLPSLKPDSGRMPMDATWLGEAIGNVIQNAIEHTPEGRSVSVELEETSVLVRVIVRDEGSGISPADMPHVFERFYRGESRKGSGTGIGLSLTKAIAERHGGYVGVRSEPGRGAVFTLAFPKFGHTLTKM